MKTLDLQTREFLAKAYVVQLDQGSFSAASLARETGKSYGYSSSVVRRLLASGLICRVSGRSVLGSGGRGNLRGLSPARYSLTSRGRSAVRVVMAGGVFDIIHPGHIHFLEEARTHGDVLVVVVARDSAVRAGKRIPVNSESDRLLVISSLRQADLAILGSSHGHEDTLKKSRPDVVCLGYDQEADLARISPLSKPLGFEIVRASRTSQGHSTSKIMGRINRVRTNNNP